MRQLKIFGLVVIIFIALLLGGYIAAKNYYGSQLTEKSGSGELVNVDIPTGSNSSQIAEILQKNNLLKNTFIYNLYLKEINAGNQLKAGKYRLPNNLSIIEVVEMLKKGADNQGLWITVKEGLRYDEISKSIANQYKSIDKTTVNENSLNQVIEQPDSASFTNEIKDFLETNKPQGKTLEGFLYPDTYNFALDATPINIVETILRNFVSKAKTLNTSAEASKFSFYENLILASIVEKEYFPNPGDPEEIAGIFLRRLSIGEKIGSDPTVLYPYKRWKPEPTAAELKKSTPYNTRLNYGLPPTPISSPGLVALKASFGANHSEYLFFIYDTQSKIHLGKNLAEHNANVAKYL